MCALPHDPCAAWVPRLAAGMAAGSDLHAWLRDLMGALLAAGGFDRVGLFRRDDEHGVLRGAWGVDRSGSVTEQTDAALREDRLPWRVQDGALAADARAVVSTEYALQQGLSDSHPMAGVRSHVAIPLVFSGSLVGVAYADNLLTGRTISEQHVTAVQALVDLGAGAIGAALLQRTNERIRRRQERLARVAVAISGRYSLSHVLRLVRDAAVEAAGFDRAGVFLYDPVSRAFLGTWGTGPDGATRDIHGDRVPLDYLPGALVDPGTGRATAPYHHTADYTADFALSPGAPMYGVRHHVTVPMVAGPDLVGAIFVDNLMSESPIRRGDIETLLPFAEQAAVAVKNARLLEELSRTQQALVESERMRAVGELAAGVAHNINNVLTAVLGYAELLERDAAPESRAHRYAGIIMRSATDGAEVVRRLQAFARKDGGEVLQPFDLTAAARDALSAAIPDSAQRSHITVRCEVAPGVLALGQREAMVDVISSLILNAVEAMPQGGVLTVRTAAGDRSSTVEVIDTGIGMDERTRARVFEPFFTTKGTEVGLGLALSVAWGVVSRCRGRIEVISTPGAGSTFRVTLPTPTSDAA